MHILIYMADYDSSAPVGPRDWVQRFTARAWRSVCEREGIGFQLESSLCHHPHFAKWMWPRFVADDVGTVILVDSDTLPNPGLTRDDFEALAGSVNSVGAAVSGCPVIHHRRLNDLRLILAPKHDWTQAVSGGVWVIQNREDTRTVSNNLLAASEYHGVQWEEDFAQCFLEKTFQIEKISRRWNFGGMSNPAFDDGSQDYLEMASVWHFCGHQKHLIPEFFQRHYGE